MSEPLVSALCCTYGRPELLGEAIRCFLDQDYPSKELIVLNDQEGVELFLDIPYEEVKIINYPKRFPNLGAKRNFLKGLAEGEFICVWDDDDIYPPWRISTSVDLMGLCSGCDIVKAKKAIMSTNNKDYQIVENLFHSQAIISREYMDKNSYPAKSVGEDIDFESGANVVSYDVVPIYVYRWGNGVHHLSGLSHDKMSWDRSLEFEPYKQIDGYTRIIPELRKSYWREIWTFLCSSGNSYCSQWLEKMHTYHL